MSNAYRYDATGYCREENSNTYYTPIVAVQGISSDLDIINDFKDANRVNFTYNTPDSELRRIYYIGGGGFSTGVRFPPIPNLTKETWYLFPVQPDAYFTNHSLSLMHGTDYDMYARGESFIPTSSTSYTMRGVRNYDPVTGNYPKEQIEYSDSDWQVNGSPHYWAANTRNSTSRVVITPNTGTWSVNGKYFFVRSQWQDRPNMDANDVRYELLDSSGSPVQDGNLGSSYWQSIDVPQGAYTLNTSYPGLLRGNPTAGTMTATFDTGLSDKKPPVIQELQIREAGERTDTVADGAGQVAVRVADADTFTVAIAVDWGDGWQDLPVTAGEFYIADISAFHPAEDIEVSLRITATDASGNRIINTVAPAFIVQEAAAPVWALAVNSSGVSGVAITADPSEYGDITDYVKENIFDGTNITLTALAASGSTDFSSWTGCDSSVRTCTVTMSADKTNYIEATDDIAVDTTGQIVIRNYTAERDIAQFKMKGVTDIGTVAKEAAASGTPLTFQFGPADDAAIYSFTADSFDAAGNRLVYSDTEGNMVRCIFSTEQCVVNIRNTDLDGEALDALLSGEMTVRLEVAGTKYANTGEWKQYDSGGGSWTKYRKNN